MADSPAPQVNLRDIAARAGVSVMTVSRALRDHPEVARRTRSRVQKLAGQLGYRPNPEVGKLMQHLRLRRKPAFQGCICALTTFPRTAHHPYNDGVLAGARDRAAQCGYGFMVLHVGEPEARRGLTRILRSRGVEGVLLLPLAKPEDLSPLLNWSEFPTVAATSSVTAPLVHRVSPNHHGNTLLLCRELFARGYRRIGVVENEIHDSRVNHAIAAAATWHAIQHSAGAEFPRPFLHADAQRAGLEEWFDREAPDSILTTEGRFCREIAQRLKLRLPGPVGFVSTYTTANSLYAGIDEHPPAIGATAINLLAAMIQRGEKGVPDSAAATMIHGRWIEGRSCPPRPRLAAAHLTT